MLYDKMSLRGFKKWQYNQDLMRKHDPKWHLLAFGMEYDQKGSQN